MSKTKNIYVVQNEALQLSQNICRGVFRYARVNKKPWRIARHSSGWHGSHFLEWTGVDGVIAVFSSEKDIATIQQPIKFPVVNTHADHLIPPFPQVDADNYQAGKMAAEYFLQKKFRSFSCLERPYSTKRCLGFRETLCKLGFEPRPFSLNGCTWIYESAQAVIREMARALRQMPSPVALYCEYDQLALQISAYLQDHGFHIPKDVAVLGTQNDDLICESILPNISSVKLPYEEVGYEAARILDLLMRNRKPPAKPILLEPVSVVERQSSDILAVPDENIQKAILYIRENASHPLKVGDIAKAAGLSLRVLQDHFRKSLGYTPQNEIRRVRIARAKELLLDTDLNLDEIAEQVTFSDQCYLIRVFRAATGLTPGNYRKQFKH